MDKIKRREAVEWAKDHARILIDNGFIDEGEEWIKAWYGHDLRWSEGDARYLTVPTTEVRPFVESALRIPAVFRLANYFVGTRLALGVPIPAEIRVFVSEYLKGELTVPHGKVGRKTAWGRDFIIINTMRQLLEAQDMTKSANRDPRGKRKRKINASEVMQEALSMTRVGHMSVENIQKIYGSKAKQAKHDEALGHYLTSILDDAPEIERI